MMNGVLYPDPLAQPIQFHSKCWESAAVQDTFLFRRRLLVMLISMMYCERLILLIQSDPIPFFECELDAGGTIHIFVIATRTQRRTWCGRAALPYPSGGGVERSWHASCLSRAIATRPRPHRACSAAAWRCPPSSRGELSSRAMQLAGLARSARIVPGSRDPRGAALPQRWPGEGDS
jgi:hypothetical protein